MGELARVVLVRSMWKEVLVSSTGLVYRTPADVRAIPNAQWEAWIRESVVPYWLFTETMDVWDTAVTIAQATKRRMDAEHRR